MLIKLYLNYSYIVSTAMNIFIGSPSAYSVSSSLEDIIQAKNVAIRGDMGHVKDARHASYISRHVSI